MRRRRFCDFRLCSRLQPGGARSHFCLILLKTGFKCSQNTVKIPTPTDTAAFWVRKRTRPACWGSNPVFSTLDGSRARARCAQRIPGPQRGPLENFRPFERAQEIFHRGARPIKSSMGKPKLGSISRSAYNRSRITRITK